MSQIKQSAAWWCFVPALMEPETFVHTLAAIGYAGIDLVPEQYWPLVTEHGLAIAAIGGHGPLAVGLNDRANHDQIERDILASLRKAQQWNIPNVLCFSGNRNGVSDETGAAATAEGLQRVARAAEEAGITLVLELLNSKVDHADYQADHTAWGVEVCRMVDSPRVKLLYDIYHMQIMEGDLIRTIQGNHQYFGHYHTAGNPGRHAIDGSQEIYYPPILGAIDATGYSGYIAHEFIPTGDARTSLQQAHDIAASGLT